MKKLWLITILTLSLLLLALPVGAATEGEPAPEQDAGAFYDAEEDSLTVKYGTKNIKCENAAIWSGDVTYLPLREVLDIYGASVSWAVGEAEDKVVITAGKERYQLVVDLKRCEAYGSNKQVYTLKHEESVLYLPVHFYADLVNCKLSWDREEGILTLDDKKKKREAEIFNPTNGGISYKKVMNLPAYVKTAAPTVSRSAGLASRSTKLVSTGTVLEKGYASYYGAKFNGRRTSSGEAYSGTALTAAHKTLPFGTVVRVTALWNGKTVDVRINDRGPYTYGRVVDLSYAAASQIGMISKGIGQVALEVLDYP